MSTTVFPESGKIVPTLAQMVRDARADQVVIEISRPRVLT
jgi:hypothetical protein